jgi:outer membrane cobalamin receptor
MYRARIAAGCAALIAAVTIFPSLAYSQENTNDLATASIESLMNMQVTSVSRRQEQLRSTAAAVYVITSDDIRRSRRVQKRSIDEDDIDEFIFKNPQRIGQTICHA